MKKHSRFTKEEIDTVMHYYSQGVAFNLIALRLNRSFSNMALVIRTHSNFVKSHRTITIKLLARVKRLTASGIDFSVIASREDISALLLRDWFDFYLEQERLFDLTKPTTVVCKDCKIEKPSCDIVIDTNNVFQYTKQCKACKLAYGRKLKFGITNQEVDTLMAQQANKCAICQVPLSECIRTDIDHCHTTGQIRGILCLQCNAGLGQFRDNPNLILNAYNYLVKHKEQSSV